MTITGVHVFRLPLLAVSWAACAVAVAAPPNDLVDGERLEAATELVVKQPARFQVS